MVCIDIKKVIDDIATGGGKATGEDDQIRFRECDVFPIDAKVGEPGCRQHKHCLGKQGKEDVVGPDDG
jgi:hypothetical protein